MKIVNYASVALALVAVACSSGQPKMEVGEEQDQATEKPLSVQMADADMKRNPQGWMIDFREQPKWDYTQGLFASAIEKVWERTGEEKYFTYIKAFADTMISEDGKIMTYKKEDYNIDRVNPGKFLIKLYKETKEEKYRLAIEEMRDQMRTHPRTSEGGFWHKKIYPHQMWLDGLYMGVPFLAQYAAEFGEPALFDEVALQIHLMDKHGWSEEKGIYYHGWDESRQQKWADQETGLSPNIWGRSVGWFAMGLVDVLDYFPQDHPKRADILKVTQKMADAIVRYQDAETGLWWQVMDQPKREGNYLEGSASSMFSYFLVKAVKQGYIDQKYMLNARKAWQGIQDKLLRKDADGGISITEVCSVAGLGGTPYRDGSYEYYVSEPKRDNDPKAVGPFIMAALEFEELEAKAWAEQ